MLNWIDERYAEERRKDMVHEAVQHELATMALASQLKRASFYGPALVYLGNWLVSWGNWLRLRYGGIAQVSIPMKAEDNYENQY
jgi:hypothetical protein